MTASDADRMQAELDAVKQQLAAAEHARADLEARLGALGEFNTALDSKITALDDANAHLDVRLDTIDQGVTMLGGRLDTLTSSNDQLNQRLLAVDDLDARLRELSEQLDTRTTITPPPPPSAEQISPPSGGGGYRPRPRTATPQETDKPRIDVTRAPMSVAPEPRTPPKTATPGGNSGNGGGWPW